MIISGEMSYFHLRQRRGFLFCFHDTINKHISILAMFRITVWIQEFLHFEGWGWGMSVCNITETLERIFVEFSGLVAYDTRKMVPSRITFIFASQRRIQETIFKWFRLVNTAGRLPSYVTWYSSFLLSCSFIHVPVVWDEEVVDIISSTSEVSIVSVLVVISPPVWPTTY